MDILLNKLPIDFAVVGEAETCFPHLLAALDTGTSFETIPGLAFKREDGSIVKNPSCRVALDQEDFLPAYEAIDLQYYIDSYRHHVIPGLGRMMPVLTGRGCKGGCSFCSPTVGRFMPRKVENILSEIEEWNRRYQFDWITFATEVFFTADEDILAFCREYKKMRMRKPWSCCFRMDQSTELLPVMKEAGCVMICAGLESGSENILPQLKRGCSVEQFQRTLDASRRIGLMLDSPFMMTNEDETEDDLTKTIDFVIQNKMDANFGLVGVYPGTPIYARALQKGLIGDEWDYMTNRMKEWP
ncbi:MAG TPA: radical SAM protein, partial [Candidatus Paceibacterota bacterium]|nr:radical SAM protein [Candidatus Paceibacterota bacterium]